MKFGKTALLLAPVLGIALSGCSTLGLKGEKKKTPVLGNRTSILGSRETTVEVDPSIADVAITLPPAYVNPDWAQAGGNAAKNMGHVQLADAPQRIWTLDIAGSGGGVRLSAEPVVQNGRLYVIDTEAKVRAIDANTGAVLWTQEVGVNEGEDRGRSLYGGGVTVSGDRVYASNGVGYVAALNTTDGSQIWKVKPGGPLRGVPTIALGNVYVLSQDNQLFALRASDGQRSWVASGSIETAAVFGVASPAVAQSTVIAGFSSGELGAYRYENGQQLWQDQLSRTKITTSVSLISDIDASPVVDQSRVYALGQGGRMVSIELITGRRLWEMSIAGISTPWIAGDWLYAVTDEGILLCIARTNGKVRWKKQLQRYRDEEDKQGPLVWKGPVLAGNNLVLTNTLGQVVYVRPEDGAVVSTVKGDKPFYLPPIVANQTLYTLDEAGRLTAWR